jgi:hypothetical protein
LMMSSAVFSDTEALSFLAGFESTAVIEGLSFTLRCADVTRLRGSPPSLGRPHLIVG